MTDSENDGLTPAERDRIEDSKSSNAKFLAASEREVNDRAFATLETEIKKIKRGMTEVRSRLSVIEGSIGIDKKGTKNNTKKNTEEAK